MSDKTLVAYLWTTLSLAVINAVNSEQTQVDVVVLFIWKILRRQEAGRNQLRENFRLFSFP